MTPEEPERGESKLLGEARAVLARSGIPFQMEVAQVFEALQTDSVGPVAEEVPWQCQSSSGHIDIVVRATDWLFCAIECKRDSTTAPIVFLTSSGGRKVGAFPAFFRELNQTNGLYVAAYMDELSIEWASQAIAKDGQGDTLKRWASDGVAAAEGLAESHVFRPIHSKRRYFIPVLVTNRPLVLCSLAAGQIGLRDGKLSEGVAPTLKSVPFVRFQKPLTAPTRSQERLENLELLLPRTLRRGGEFQRELANAERCLWVVDASFIREFIGLLEELAEVLRQIGAR